MKIIYKAEVLGKEFNVYGENGINEIYFLAKDVAEWLGMDVSNASRMIKNVDEEECITVRHNMTSATFLTEDGLYEVLMQSRKPIAKQFKKEIKKVLKSIRENGYYIASNKDNGWLITRNDAKVVRKQETDAIKELVEYAKEQGSKNADRYYISYTNLANKKMGISSKERDNLSQEDLLELKSIETIIKRKIRQGIEKGLHYKDIYNQTKEFVELI